MIAMRMGKKKIRYPGNVDPQSFKVVLQNEPIRPDIEKDNPFRNLN